MNTAIWANLFWKEWREHQWKLAALVAVAVILHVWVLDATRPGGDRYAMPLAIMLMVVLPIGSGFVAMGIAAGERSRHTISFLRSLPLSLRAVAATKLVVGIVVIWLAQVVAVLLSMVVLWLGELGGWTRINSSLNSLSTMRIGLPIEEWHWSIGVLLVSLAVSASLVVWVAAVSVNSESEVRAGVIGLVVVVALWSLFSYQLVVLVQSKPEPEKIAAYEMMFSYLAIALPGGAAQPMANISSSFRDGVALLIYCSVHLSLAGWYVMRFGRPGLSWSWLHRDSTRPSANSDVFLAPPQSSPIVSLAWKQFRQGLPVMLTAFLGALCLWLTLYMANYKEVSGVQSERYAAMLSAMAMGSFLVLGCCAGLVGGVGTLAADLDSKLYTFWRSRPISIDTWFCSAFAAGLLMLLLTFGLPILIGEQVFIRQAFAEPIPIPVVTILLLSYTTGVLSASLVRQAAYASVLSIVLFAGVLGLAASEWIPNTRLSTGAVILAACVLTTLLAWQVVRRDWAIYRS